MELAADRKTATGSIRRGDLPAVVVNIKRDTRHPRYRVRRDDIDRFIEARQVEPPRPARRRRRRRPPYPRIV